MSIVPLGFRYMFSFRLSCILQEREISTWPLPYVLSPYPSSEDPDESLLSKCVQHEDRSPVPQKCICGLSTEGCRGSFAACADAGAAITDDNRKNTILSAISLLAIILLSSRSCLRLLHTRSLVKPLESAVRGPLPRLPCDVEGLAEHVCADHLPAKPLMSHSRYD